MYVTYHRCSKLPVYEHSTSNSVRPIPILRTSDVLTITTDMPTTPGSGMYYAEYSFINTKSRKSALLGHSG